MFDDMKLSDDQLKAACYDGGNLLLVAGPGSGKTHTMTARILFLTEKKHVDPSKILVITFTRDAALSMRNRYISNCGAVSPVSFGTFHSVFYHMITDHMKPDVPKLVFDKNKRSVAMSCVKRFIQDIDSEDAERLTGRFLSAVSFYKNTLDLEAVRKRTDRLIGDNFTDMFRYYEAARKKGSMMDFDDMVYDLGSLLKNDACFSRKWKGRFDHILIDEFQDINPVQFDNVKALCGKKTRVFAVGDDDQSIYGFRGSDPHCIKRYIGEMNPDVYHLGTNYRSGEEIVRSSLLVIKDNKNRLEKDLRSGRGDIKGELIIKGFEGRHEEYETIAASSADKNSTRAVLFRTNPGMQGFASYLSSKNIPFRIRENFTGIFDHYIMEDIFAYLRVSINAGSREDLRRVVNTPERAIDRELLTECEDLDHLMDKIRTDPYTDGRMIKLKKLEVLKKDLEFMGRMTPNLAVRYLLGKVGYGKYLRRKAGTDKRKRDDQDAVVEKCLEIASLAETYEDLEILKEDYEKDIRRAVKNTDRNVLDLMTIHASKGLEFDKVFIPDCNEGNIPHGRMLDEETAEEERRVFYVGMTRAVSELHLYYISGSENSKYIPSRFLNPVRSKKPDQNLKTHACSMEKSTHEE